tara:strand:- start:715 stop:915 length:201 start_codon:yes stop_codon:yes gene_type:complete
MTKETNIPQWDYNQYMEIEEELQSDYRLYCSKFNEMYPNQKPLSYNVWMHTDTSNVDAHKFDDLPF